MERCVREGLERRKKSTQHQPRGAVTEELCAGRVASDIVRWVVATAQGAKLARREGQLNAVASEILRSRANTPPVQMRI